MIILKPKAGLCNRMRAVSSAEFLANKYNKKVFVLWNMDSGLNCRFDTLFEKIPNVYVLNYRLKFDFISRMIQLFIKNKFIDARIKQKSEIENAVKSKKFVYISTFCNIYEENNFKKLIIVPEIQSKIDALIPETKKNLVGIHIRRTDHIKAIENSPTELFVKEINKEITESPDTCFYLATDSYEEEKNLKEIFNNRIITNSSRELSRNSSQGIVDALVDLGCLNKCSKIIGSDWSSFSWTASMWNYKRPLITIDRSKIPEQVN